MSDRPTLAPGGGPWSPLSVRVFRWFWMVSFLSNIGSWMQLVTVPYVVDQLTHSTAWVGVAAFCSLFPIAATAPIAGAWADRYARRRIAVLGQCTMLTSTLTLLVLWATGAARPVSILACVMVSAVGTGIANVSTTPLVSELVPPHQFLAALRLNVTQTYAARAVGPAFAGMLLAAVGPGPAFAVNALTFLPLLLVLRVVPATSTSHHEDGRAWRQFREGLSYVRAKPALALCMRITGAVGFLGLSIIQLIEPLARHVLHRSAGEYGLLFGCYGAGAMSGAILSVVLGQLVRGSRQAVVGFLATSASVVALGLGSYGVALAAAAALGAASVVTNMAVITSCQANTDDAYRGRVHALLNVYFNGSVPLGALAGGLLAGVVGLRVVFVGAGALGMVLLALLVRSSASLLALDRSATADPVVDELALEALEAFD
ncbi:MAG: hypothetical protein JWN67_3314 [Actinomycetia bacterium]|nr:hypothetical protein [Actinomycetes bacterium]